ncbi:Hypothetical predicted protein [Cloeon dipterum]|uniref:Guanylate cyclase n=1 Tax=Cloeon dipterum TaxID=197152 RepID=A0A8S1DCT7_9INSE|nr:Hypothetical predicted protein [Cloeon dipterum]
MRSFLLWTLLVLCECSAEGHRKTVHLWVIAPSDPNHEQSLVKIMPAIMLAVRRVRDTRLLDAVHLEVHQQDSQCSSTYGPLAAFHFYTQLKSGVFLGPVCDYVIAPVARYAGVWGVPVITAGGQADAFQHKTQGQYPSLTRMTGSYSAIGHALKSILKQFGWHVVGLLYHNHGIGSARGHSLCHFALAAVFTALNSTPAHRSFDQEKTTYPDYLKLLHTVAESARIVVVCANQTTVREILLAAEELNMVGSGEYVFFNIELYSGNAVQQPWNVSTDPPERNERARKAYEALLTVTARTPKDTEYEQFSSEIGQLARDRYNFTYASEEGVSTFVTAFHDAVLLYAHALRETLDNNGTERDGEDITRRMWNRTFTGIAGDVTIDSNGDRVADYSLLDLDPETNSFHVVANYVGQNRSLEFEPGKKIHWAGGRTSAPLDTPVCGFDGSLCPDNSLPGYAILSIVLSSVVVVLSIVSFFIYRHYKIEAAIASMTWRISWSEINVMGMEAAKRGGGSVHSLAKSVNTLYSEDAASIIENNRQMFVPTAVYKGSKVAIKIIYRDRVDLVRPLLLELKKMKDIHHQHLVRFIGACIEPPHCCLLTEYCPRGSLQDILEHEQIQLDPVFRYSLMHDAVKGMCFLHASDIRTHGNLKSSNCVVDSRFVLKIADFGLHSLRGVHSSVDLPNTDAYAYWKRQLWTAPELLRMKYGPPLEGTQKGDVYSFGIIMHEILSRQGAFYLPEHAEYSPREIVEAVKAGVRPLMRPSLSGLQCEPQVVQLMTSCWAEDPIERPDFSYLKSAIRRLNSGHESSNILDNLLRRMEQYANNLETLVEERTTDYLEEKRKCEELLYQLLPKSVASQLILGNSVIAETYDNVTIYFSDIVGFTSLSAESTPLQVVDLLNDLYTCFDSIIENFDVYKVETIGDAYMVVSGLPVRNGDNHAREIARMALAMLNTVLGFKIRHRPDQRLKLRIGLHSGPCVAGVVGLKMPRYCLFGDTVNTASRMESNGLALKIHVSSATKAVLDIFKTFHLELRGEVEMKGKGKQTTYWLVGENAPAKAASAPKTPSLAVCPAFPGVGEPLGPNGALNEEPTSSTPLLASTHTADATALSDSRL